MYIQVMTFEEAEKFRWNPFDLTKVWYQNFHCLPIVTKYLLHGHILSCSWLLDLATFWVPSHSSWQNGAES